MTFLKIPLPSFFCTNSTIKLIINKHTKSRGKDKEEENYLSKKTPRAPPIPADTTETTGMANRRISAV